MRDLRLPSGAEVSGEQVCFDTQGLALCVETSSIQPLDPGECPGTTTGVAPTIRQGKPTVSPGIDPYDVRVFVRAHLAQLRRCYEAELHNRAPWTGKIVLAFEINRRGKVVRSRVESSTPSFATAVGECMVKASRRWRFTEPKPDGTVQVRIPFSLSLG